MVYMLIMYIVMKLQEVYFKIVSYIQGQQFIYLYDENLNELREIESLCCLQLYSQLFRIKGNIEIVGEGFF